MIKLQALKPISGNYGVVTEGQQFDAEERDALQLEARGLACRVHIGLAERIGKAFIGAPENKRREQVIVYAPIVSPPIERHEIRTAPRRRR